MQIHAHTHSQSHFYKHVCAHTHTHLVASVILLLVSCKLSVLWERISLCSPGWPRVHCMDQDSLKLVGFFLPKFSKCWDYRHESILMFCIILSCKKFKVQDSTIVHLNWQHPKSGIAWEMGLWACLLGGCLETVGRWPRSLDWTKRKTWAEQKHNKTE